jgi:hypothetical protein
VIIFYLIKHQTPYTHPSNFNYVFEVIIGMLQLPFWFAFEPWLTVGLVFMQMLLNQSSHPYIQKG